MVFMSMMCLAMTALLLASPPSTSRRPSMTVIWKFLIPLLPASARTARGIRYEACWPHKPRAQECAAVSMAK
uniref:Putative secreted protein n=1 Tax=Anopheles darlingi TaxID=43151 RepID=A0A2M4D415_ANODA